MLREKTVFVESGHFCSKTLRTSAIDLGSDLAVNAATTGHGREKRCGV